MKGSSQDLMVGDKVQTSIRLPQQLLTDVQRAAGMRGKTMNSLVTELLRGWKETVGSIPIAPTGFEERSEDASTDKETHYLKQFLRWFPAATLVRERHGAIIIANGEYLGLVGKDTVGGHLPGDDFDPETARLIMERHHAVLESKDPILSTETICFRGEPKKRLTLRFPMVKETEVQWVGTISFDLTLISTKTSLIEQKVPWQRAYKLAERPSLEYWKDRLVAWPKSLLKDFIACLPVIATVKDLDGYLLCPNPEYTRVTGKAKEDVVGRLPIENWGGDNELLAQVIMYHDLLVRETGAPFISVESFPTSSGNEERLNIRFPIFGSDGALEFTGQLGFTYSAIKELLELGDKESQVHLRRPS